MRSVFILSLIFVSIAASPLFAKVLPRFQKTNTPARTTAVSVGIYPKLRVDRHALIVNFSNLQLANSVSFTLIYQTNGKEEGASGSADVSQRAVTRELLFGTCSTGVCRYHTNITNARLEVITDLKSGKKTIKRFRIKV